jgi:flagellar motor switch protein FliN/FliY
LGKASTVPAQAGALAAPTPPADAGVDHFAFEKSLVPSEHEADAADLIRLSPPIARLPVELDVSVAVRDFRVRNLLALERGHVIATQWGHGDDVPLTAGQVQLAWSEFEVVDDSQLAVRVTRMI